MLLKLHYACCSRFQQAGTSGSLTRLLLGSGPASVAPAWCGLSAWWMADSTTVGMPRSKDTSSTPLGRLSAARHSLLPLDTARYQLSVWCTTINFVPAHRWPQQQAVQFHSPQLAV